jgi:cell division protein FtsN
MAGMVPASPFARRSVERRPALGPEGDDDATGGRDQSGGRYSVQVGPYRSSRQAAAARTRLRNHGYEAEQDGHVLRIGSFSSRTRASAFASRLRVNGYRSKIVTVQ